MEQGLHQGSVLAPLMFNMFFAVVIIVTYTRFKADKEIIDALMHLREKTGWGWGWGGNHRKDGPGDVAVGQGLR